MRIDHDDNTRTPLEILMSHRSKRAHDRISAMLWDADSDQDAVAKLAAFAESPDFDLIQTTDDEEEGETEELANIRKERKGDWHKRRKRDPKPKRTPEEIAQIRAERAAKKERLAREAAEAASAAES